MRVVLAVPTSFTFKLLLMRTMPFGLLVALATLPSCKSKSADTTSTTSAPPSASAIVAAAVPSTSGSTAEKNPSACALVGEPFSVAKGARSDTGVTVARLPDGRLAVGYAVKTTPRVAVLDLEARTATQVDVDAAALSSEPGSAEQGSATFINRVTPVAAAGLKMRVLVDAAVTLADKTKRVRCGFADAAPIFTATSGVDVAITWSIGSPTPIADAQAGDRGRSPKGRVGRRGRTTSPRGKPTFLEAQLSFPRLSGRPEKSFGPTRICVSPLAPHA